MPYRLLYPGERLRRVEKSASVGNFIFLRLQDCVLFIVAKPPRSVLCVQCGWASAPEGLVGWRRPVVPGRTVCATEAPGPLDPLPSLGCVPNGLDTWALAGSGSRPGCVSRACRITSLSFRLFSG